MDSSRILRQWLVCLVAAGGMSLLLPAAPAAAAVGTLKVNAPTAPIAFNASFSMTINFENTSAAAIEDPDIALYIMARNSGGVAQPLLPANVTVTAPGIPMYKWDTGGGNQVGVKFYPDLHVDLAPGWNSNYIINVTVAMPPGTALLPMAVRAWRSTNSAIVYDSWAGQVAVNPVLPPPPPPPPPAPATSTPAPLPSATSAAPATASPTPAEPSPTQSEPSVFSAEPIAAVTVGAPSNTGMSWWVWLALFMIAASAGMLVWLVLRWRQDHEPSEG